MHTSLATSGQLAFKTKFVLGWEKAQKALDILDHLNF